MSISVVLACEGGWGLRLGVGLLMGQAEGGGGGGAGVEVDGRISPLGPA